MGRFPRSAQDYRERRALAGCAHAFRVQEGCDQRGNQSSALPYPGEAHGARSQHSICSVLRYRTAQFSDDSAHEWQRLLEMCCASFPFARAATHLQSPPDAAAFILLQLGFEVSVLRGGLASCETALRRPM